MTQRPKKPIDRMKEWVQKLGDWVDGVIHPREPELVPIPIRRPGTRRRR